MTKRTNGSELAELRALVSQQADQMAALHDRLAYFEQHHTPQLPDPITEKPNGKLSSRLDASFHSRLDRLAGQLRTIVADRYASWSINDNFSQSGWIGKLDQYPRSVAAELVGLTAAKEDLDGKKRAELLTGRDNKAAIERLTVEVSARERHVELLLRSMETIPELPKLPPIPQVLLDQLPDSEKAAIVKRRQEVGSLPVGSPMGVPPADPDAPNPASRPTAFNRPTRGVGRIERKPAPIPTEPAEKPAGRRDGGRGVIDGVRQVAGPLPSEHS